ncbi:hypothetical protein [Streptomyces decoyicus]|uniref:hypothetical protein n=1 Tax=Streptomyces decoyicus TaxID=249567 RepID=UPI0004AADA2B|nr:hypothetical protein [Streptomyces decoyicus]KOG39019.1 hypothetical protein ADK74_30385 [Streptomyces decoyicus]QZY16584.1 hypothetical protein K7C20_16090 [Streptomyces decoyicus]
MTYKKKALIVGALALSAFGGATAPALADSHTPAPPHSVVVPDNHMPVIPSDSHLPLAPLDSHTP